MLEDGYNVLNRVSSAATGGKQRGCAHGHAVRHSPRGGLPDP
jgi:hypothetical protein